MINIADDANSVKRALLQYGHITACPKPGHLCALVGFEYLEAGDSLNINDGYGVIVGEDTIPDFIKVPENHPFIGKTAWIFKENFGINRGENGYLIKLATSGDIITGGGFFAFDYPGYCDMIEPDWYYWDGDGYYFWGLGPKPAGCPGPDLEDCDDFDVQRIYYDENYFCTYDCDLIASMMSDEPIYINNDTTIYGDKLVKPIVVDNNSTLKLSGEFHCAENVYIQAEIGSTIDLDGATFMSICGTTWQGIRLISNLDPLLGETGRSMLISDYSEIQNAECAISGDVHSIIRADNTRFVDNLCDLKLQPSIYTNFYGEVTIGNNSEFNDCMFYTSHNWHNQSIEENIILKYVKNVNFNSCFFEDQGIVIDKFSMENRTAIKTYHSGFNATECTFTHNSYAAQIINSLYLPVNLENNTIINNYRGFYLLQTHGSIIIHNDLQFDDDLCRTSDANEIPYGIYLDNCHDYQLERNIIRYYDTESISDYICGIVINDNGGFQDKIYRNIIGKLSVGMEAIGVNRDIINYNDGLQISCNTLNSVYNDIFVTNNLNNPYPSEYPIGIAGNQGSLQYPAGNLFTGENNSGSGEDPNPHDDLKVIENYINVINDTKSFNYYYHDLSENTRVLPDSVIGLVTLVETNVIYDENSCPDYTDTESSETQTGIHALNSLVLDITNKENTLEYLIDGGNTDMTIAEIILASDYFAYETYLGLIAKSPYLSKKSLIEIAMKEDGLTVPMIRDILVKNPHAAKDPEIKTILKQRIDVLPDYMLEQIEQGLKLVSAKDYLEAQISVLETEFNRQSAVLLRKYIRDTEIYGESDFMQVLDLNPDFQSQLISSEYYALNRDFNTAKSIINTIVAKTEEQQAILTNMSNLYNVMIELELTNSDESEYKDLTGKDKILLEIAAGNGPAAAYAKGMLSWSGYMVYKEPVFLPSVDIYPGDRNLGIDKLK
ncbi:MAG: hypothetical protein C0596_16060 [Marinilabiliales bacterium]|nr:MAG: hypothetical protein C0596_16060 [Marinilabiliales bacterium]